MLNGYHIAIVEDDEIMGSSLVQRLEIEGAKVLWLRQIARAIGALRTPRRPIDAVICDIRLPDGSGEELFNQLCQTTTPPPFLFVTGHGGIEQAVRLIRAGAADYVTKPFDMQVLLERLASLLAQGPQESLPSILGISPAALRVEELTNTAAAIDRSVLIIGGPGTGKGLVARRVHALSDRCAAPFVTVNLAREADAATRLFMPGGALDEVGEGVLYLHDLTRLPDAVQMRLLSVLERGFSGRIVASCGPRPNEIAEQGDAAVELFYRLDIMEIPIPPLSERAEDAVWLMSQLFPALNGRRTVPLDRISRLSEEAVRSHDWPGGGRELRARLARGILAAQGPYLQPADLFPDRVAEGADWFTLAEMREAAERRHIVETLERFEGRVGLAAQALKVSRTTLWDKMQKLGIQRDSD